MWVLVPGKIVSILSYLQLKIYQAKETKKLMTRKLKKL